MSSLLAFDILNNLNFWHLSQILVEANFNLSLQASAVHDWSIGLIDSMDVLRYTSIFSEFSNIYFIPDQPFEESSIKAFRDVNSQDLRNTAIELIQRGVFNK